ncbi:MAG: Nudix family hydrolase [Gammaproteobacteria bacterium]|nr:Nudix family hydrolase [Gammaproteobacteria bacterium]
MTTRVHVVAAVITDERGNIFIAKRPADKHQGGLWEFPGGKREADETPLDALKRELHEEIGIDVIDARPLIQINHDYPDKSVLLDTWKVTEFSGEAHGKEGQETSWVRPDALDNYPFPAANQPIITAAQLPDSYAVTPEPRDEDSFYRQLEGQLRDGIRLIQLRIKERSEQHIRRIIDNVQTLADAYRARVMLNTYLPVNEVFGSAGRHLNTQQLLSLEQRPISEKFLLSASCHSSAELQHALTIGVDFIVISPVLRTSSHPEATPLGWEKLKSLCEESTVPAYALGGMEKAFLNQAFSHGAQGIAGISTFFTSKNITRNANPSASRAD